MSILAFIVIFSLVVLAGVMVYASTQKQWATVLAMAGIFATIVTGAYAYYKMPLVTNTIQNIVGK